MNEVARANNNWEVFVQIFFSVENIALLTFSWFASYCLLDTFSLKNLFAFYQKYISERSVDEKYLFLTNNIYLHVQIFGKVEVKGISVTQQRGGEGLSRDTMASRYVGVVYFSVSFAGSENLSPSDNKELLNSAKIGSWYAAEQSAGFARLVAWRRSLSRVERKTLKGAVYRVRGKQCQKPDWDAVYSGACQRFLSKHESLLNSGCPAIRNKLNLERSSSVTTKALTGVICWHRVCRNAIRRCCYASVAVVRWVYTYTRHLGFGARKSEPKGKFMTCLC